MDRGLMIEIKNWAIGIVTGVFTVLFFVLPMQGLQLLRGTVQDLPQTPADFVPAVRLVAFTDSHNCNDHVADAIDTAYALFDEDEVYAGVDGFFGLGNYSRFDGTLAMYHDQGLAPFKAIAFADGVNFTAGLPIVRTSPDHGTAYDMAGRDEADPRSMMSAIYTAIDIFRRRLQYDTLHEARAKR